MRFMSSTNRRWFSTRLCSVRRGALCGLELVAVPDQDIELIFCVGGIILGMARGKGFAVFRQRCGIDREEDQEVVLLQCVDDRPFRELEAYRYGSALKALSY